MSEIQNLILCYYITGHGLGHASRSVEIILGILQLKTLSKLYIVSSKVLEEFFHYHLNEYIGHHLPNKASVFIQFRDLDTGAIQTGPLEVNPLLTLETYYKKIHSNHEKLLNFEVGWIEEQNIDIVIVDASPLPCYAAKLAHVKKVVVISNFTWCYIYREMLKSVEQKELIDNAMYEKYVSMVEQCTIDYNMSCDVYLQLPGSTPLPIGFDICKVKTVPLLSRKFINQIDILYYGCDNDVKVLLLGFGGHDTSWSLQDHYLPDGWICYVLGAQPNDMPSSRFISLDYNSYVPDYINIADAVLGKVGYGFVSECINHGVPLIFLSRSEWPEEIFLIKLLEDYHAGIPMDLNDFNNGRWLNYLSLAMQYKKTLTVQDIHESSIQIIVDYIFSD